MRAEEESKNIGLKLNIQKPKIIAFSSIFSIEVEKLGAVTGLIFLGSKITVDDDCNLEIKMLAPWKKSYDKLSILKSGDITFLTKIPIVKAMFIPVVMYRCEVGP